MELFPHCVNKFLYQLWAEDIWFHRSALVPSPHKLGESSGLPAELWGKRSAGVGESLPVEPPAQLAASCSAVLVFFFRDPLKIENHFFQ